MFYGKWFKYKIYRKSLIYLKFIIRVENKIVVLFVGVGYFLNGGILILIIRILI